MKEFNKILYDILLKLESKKKDQATFKINEKLIFEYFNELKDNKNSNFKDFDLYFTNFYDFCFEIPYDNMIRDALKFKY